MPEEVVCCGIYTEHSWGAIHEIRDRGTLANQYCKQGGCNAKRIVEVSVHIIAELEVVNG